MIVCLAFKRKIPIGIARKQQPPYPLENIDKIEKYISELSHLPGVDRLMVLHHGIDLHILLRKDDSEQIYCSETSERYETISDYFHQALSIQ